MKFRCTLKRVVDDSYDIEIGRRLQQSLIDDLKNGLTGKARKFAVVTDSTVEGLYASEITEMLRDAAADSGRTVRLIETLMQSRDHPASLHTDQSWYLKGCILNVE